MLQTMICEHSLKSRRQCLPDITLLGNIFVEIYVGLSKKLFGKNKNAKISWNADQIDVRLPVMKRLFPCSIFFEITEHMTVIHFVVKYNKILEYQLYTYVLSLNRINAIEN